MTIKRQRLLARLGHEFNDSALLDLALTHRSCGARNNERLEFLGDAALNFIIGEALYQRLGSVAEGDLSRQRASLVKGLTLAEVARELSLGEHLLLGAGEMKSGGHRRDSILADTTEAIIGAIYLDAGMEACKACVLNWFSSRLKNASASSDHKDAKTRLQEFLQAQGRPLPEYVIESVNGEQHSQIFSVQCTAEGLTAPVSGQASSRKQAEKLAAEKALKILRGDNV